MKNLKKILASLLVVVMVLTAAPLSGFVGLELPDFDFGIKASALSTSGYCGENVTYTYNSSTGELVISGTGAMWSYDYGDSPFYDSDIKSVVIGGSVTIIGAYAFNKCTSLTSVTIPDSVTIIGGYAFCDCVSLNNVTIGDNVITIGDKALNGCSNLTNISIGDNVETIGGYAFYNTGYYNNSENWENDVLYIDDYLIKAKESIAGPYTIKDGIKLIADYAFEHCHGLTKITIPNSVTIIGRSSFEDCDGLECVTIPDSVTTIDNEAFYSCGNLTNITIGDGITSIGDYVFNYTGYYHNSSNWENNVLYIGKYLIKANTSLSGSYTIKDGTRIIANSAFQNCSKLINVVLPSSLIAIAEWAFFDCIELVSVTIPNGTTTIGINAFGNCYNLTNVTIPDSVTTIDSDAFYYCNSLTSMTVPDSVTTIGDSIFYSCANLESLTIGKGIKEIPRSCFSGLTALKNVNLSEGLEKIGSYAFCGCNSLTSIIIPNSVTTISDYAFDGCIKLTSITIGDGVTSFDGFYFNQYKNLETLNIGKRIKEIPANTFVNLTTLKTINLSEGLEKIGDGAFANCPYLENINFPNSLVNMGKDILKNTAWFNYRGKGLIVYDNWIYGYKGDMPANFTLTIESNIRGVATGALAGYSNLKEFCVTDNNSNYSSENGVLYNKDKTVVWCYPAGSFYSTYEIPDSVNEIYSEAFDGCYKLDSIKVSKNLKKIGASAFNNVGSLKIYIADLEAWCKIDFSNHSANPLNNGGSLYLNDNLVSSLVIPDTITEIKPYAFFGCGSIKRVTMSDSLITVGSSAFYDCFNFRSITFGKGIQTVEKSAFGMCVIKDVYYPCSQEDWENVRGISDYELSNATLYLKHSHNYMITMLKEATCDVDGQVLYTCKLGDNFIDVIPARGHNWVDLGGSVKATCTTNGIDNYKCSNCGEEKKGEVLSLGHDWEYIEHTYATCDKDGYMSRVCLREGCDEKEEKVTPAFHEMDYWDVESPTCTEPGKMQIGCMNCSDANDVVVIPAKGHTYSEWVELLPATCSERGLNIKICNDCNDIQRQIIPKIAHIDADGNGVCDNCEGTYNSDATDTPEEPDAPEEPDTPEVPDTPDIPDKPEEEPCDCDCHAGGIKAFFFKLINFFAKILDKDARTCECGAAH